MQENRSNNVYAIHTNLTETMKRGLRTSGLSFQRPTIGKLPYNDATGTQYNIQNLVPLAEKAAQMAKDRGIPETAADMRFMSYKQARDQGFEVLEGSKSTQISFFSWTDKEPVYDANGEPELGDNGKQKMQTVNLDKPVLKPGYVFQAWQLGGKNFEFGQDRPAEDKEAALNRAEALVKASGAVIVHNEKTKVPFYDRYKDQINMPPAGSFPSREALIGETINQLAHWSSHESRLNRSSGPNGSPFRNREELTTGLGAWAVLNTLGVEGATFDNRNPHVPGMLKLLDSSPYEAMRCCKAADQIRNHLMGLERHKDLAAEVSHEAELETVARVAAVGKPTHEMPGLQVMTPEEELGQKIKDAGLELGGKPIIWTGETVVLQGGKGTYSATKDVIPEAVIRNHETGIKLNWVASGHMLTKDAVKAQDEKTQSVRKERKAREKGTEKGLDAGKMPPPSRGKGQSRGLSL